jgi:hypothetical protein
MDDTTWPLSQSLHAHHETTGDIRDEPETLALVAGRAQRDTLA